MKRIEIANISVGLYSLVGSIWLQVPVKKYKTHFISQFYSFLRQNFFLQVIGNGSSNCLKWKGSMLVYVIDRSRSRAGFRCVSITVIPLLSFSFISCLQSQVGFPIIAVKWALKLQVCILYNSKSVGKESPFSGSSHKRTVIFSDWTQVTFLLGIVVMESGLKSRFGASLVA